MHGPGAGAVTFASEDLGSSTPDFYCTQDHRLVLAFTGLEWIESELFKLAVKRIPLPKP